MSRSIETSHCGSDNGGVDWFGAGIHSLPAAEVLTLLGSRPQGLTWDEVQERLGQYGPNRIRREAGKSIWRKLLANLIHLMAWLLCIGGAIAWIAQTPQLAVAVWMVKVMNGVFSFWQEYRVEKATEALQQLLPCYTRMLRAGRLIIPHGNTVLLADDEVLAVVDAAHLQELSSLLGHGE